MRCDASEIVCDESRLRVFGATNATADLERLAEQLLRLRPLAQMHQRVAQIVHRQERVWMLRPQHTALRVKRLAQQILRVDISIFVSQSCTLTTMMNQANLPD